MRAALIHVATENPVKVRAVEAVLRDFLCGSEGTVRRVGVPQDLPKQPLDDQVPGGAVARARAALDGGEADLGVGIEAGLIRLPGSDRWINAQVCAIADREGELFIGLGPGFELPADFREAVLSGEPLSAVLQRLRGLDDEDRRGAVGHLSEGRIDRLDLTREAVRMAWVSRMGRDVKPKA
jgi:inosine/xanthosine triphosphatase